MGVRQTVFNISRQAIHQKSLFHKIMVIRIFVVPGFSCPLKITSYSQTFNNVKSIYHWQIYLKHQVLILSIN